MKKIVIDNEKENQVKDLLGIDDPNKINREQAKLTTEAILERKKEIEAQVKDLSPEEKALVYEELLKDYGVTTEQVTKAMGNLDPALPPSAIFSNLGWLPISEMLQRISLRYDFTELIPYKIIENGLHRIFYRDFRKVDNRSAYKQADYTFDPIHNPAGGIVVEEIWKVYMNIHAGFTMWDASLNQNTRSIELFIAMFNELEWNIGEPIAVELYRLRMKLIAEDLEFNGVLDTDGTPRGTDWSTLTPDITIDGTNDYDALEKLFAWMIGLGQSSRKQLPERWKPTGLDQNLMGRFNMNDYILIGPVAFIQHLNVSMKSGRFNDQYLKMLPEFLGIDFEKSFGEFNGDTNFKTDYTEADLRLVPKPSGNKGVWIISQYDALRTQPNLNLTSVAHEWMLVGHAFHRLTPVFRIKFKSAGGDGSGGVDKVGDLSTLTTNSKGTAVDAINEVNQKATDNASNIATNITHIGDLTKLTTTAKASLVEATNEVNAKQPASKK